MSSDRLSEAVQLVGKLSTENLKLKTLLRKVLRRFPINLSFSEMAEQANCGLAHFLGDDLLSQCEKIIKAERSKSL